LPAIRWPSGHYAGDTIISAEKSLDAALEGLLRPSSQLGI